MFVSFLTFPTIVQISVSDVVFGSKRSGRSVEWLLHGPACGRQESLFVQSEVVGTSPEDERGGLHSRRQLVRQREVGEEESASASMSLEVEATLSRGESRAKLTLIVQEQVFGVVDLLEKLRSCIVTCGNLLLLTIESPADFLTTSVVVHFLEALARVNVCKLFTLSILSEINNELSDGISAFLFLSQLLLQVSLNVFFNLLLLIYHFNY